MSNTADYLFSNDQGWSERSRVERPRAEEPDPPKAPRRPQGRSRTWKHVNRSASLRASGTTKEAPQGRRPRGSQTNVEAGRGVIHDIGYRNYRGPLEGRGHAVRALFGYSVRAAFGLGRSARWKVLPFLLLGLSCLPATVLVAITAVSGQTILPYGRYTYYLQVATLVFVAAQAPVLVVGDLRHRVLPLYFSRPLERRDYVVAKLGALSCALFIVIGAPILILYLGGMLVGADVLGETGRFLPAIAGAAAYAVVLAAVGLALACLTRRRMFAVVAISGVYLVTNAVVSATKGVADIVGSEVGAYLGVFTPYDLLDGFQSWALGTPAAAPSAPTGAQGALYGLVTAAVLAGSVGVMLRRYRRVEQ